jgi:hypothetical protein
MFLMGEFDLAPLLVNRRDDDIVAREFLVLRDDRVRCCLASQPGGNTQQTGDGKTGDDQQF